MFNTHVAVRRRGREEAEKPFWISFSDLMTALMVLFMVAMMAALLVITKPINDQEKKEKKHAQALSQFMDELSRSLDEHEGVQVDKGRHIVNFGERARFPFAQSTLSPSQEGVLRQFAAEILNLADAPQSRGLLKKIVIEGYTDTTGTYLSNINLSLQRSQRVLCALFAEKGEALLSDSQKLQVRDLFVVGGYSFNDGKKTAEESRRVEIRLEFFGVGEQHPVLTTPTNVDFGQCAIHTAPTAPLPPSAP
ncbi:flagellar motor protein MotB [Leptothrix ochracea]|uniref:OmpA/MotB family protein n=1 Tax=Leptothrix ochracea TaxID=735331 RepID=UPI0034E2F90D